LKSLTKSAKLAESEACSPKDRSYAFSFGLIPLLKSTINFMLAASAIKANKQKISTNLFRATVESSLNELGACLTSSAAVVIVWFGAAWLAIWSILFVSFLL
jgi:hypothetical protein